MSGDNNYLNVTLACDDGVRIYARVSRKIIKISWKYI